MKNQIRHLFVVGCYVIAMAALTGCGGVGSVVYRPEIRSDMTYAAAVNDLQNVARAGQIYTATGPFTPIRSIANIIVYENGTVRWELPPKPGLPGAYEMSLLTLEKDLTVHAWGPAWAIELPSFMLAGPLPALQKASNDLYCIQQKAKKSVGGTDGELALFEPLAAEYRSLAIKPRMSEEQRRWVVQANAQSQQKQYLKAIDLYEKAVDLDPVSYPAAYFNLALLCEQQHWYGSAITHMRKYLLLVPEAQDARSAQDKIYEWEGMSRK